MARKKKQLPLFEKVTITDVAAEGMALARVNDLVVFVPYVVPGDVVDLQVKRKKNCKLTILSLAFAISIKSIKTTFWARKRIRNLCFQDKFVPILFAK